MDFFLYFCTVKYATTMINRTLLRTKTVQVLYSMYVKHDIDLVMAESELATSARKSYDLYNSLLLLLVEVHRLACMRNDVIHNRIGERRGENAISERFIRNRFINQLAENDMLNTYVAEEKLSWADHPEIAKSILDNILASDYYQNYNTDTGNTYDTDRELWRKIVKNEFINNDALESTIEDINSHWAVGADLILQFVIKTIKTFDPVNENRQPLLAMFDKAKGENLQYATMLIDNVLLHNSATDAQITKYLKDWDYNRLPLMDKVIIKCGIEEMSANKETPVPILINEYIEIAKSFSSPQSARFINGILDKIAKENSQVANKWKAEAEQQ